MVFWEVDCRLPILIRMGSTICCFVSMDPIRFFSKAMVKRSSHGLWTCRTAERLSSLPGLILTMMVTEIFP